MAADKTALLVQVVNLDLPSTEARDDERQTIRVYESDDRETMFHEARIAQLDPKNQLLFE